MQGPDIPPGEYFVNCVQYRDRVADLSRDNPTGAIIGFHNQNGSNQRWTFHPHHDSRFRKWKISTVTSKGVVCYAHTNAEEDEVVFCKTEESQGTIYGVSAVTGGLFRIFDPRGPGGTSFFWTLGSEAEETQVKIHRGLGASRTQVWSLTRTK